MFNHSIYTNYFLRQTGKSLTFLLTFIFIFDFLFFASPVLARDYLKKELTSAQIQENILKKNTVQYTVKSRAIHTITAYNSEVAQCDSTPCVTANQFNLCVNGVFEDSVAINSLPFGTKIRIPELFGDKIFIVRDRTNARYRNRLDIWMEDKRAAIKFGVQRTEVEVLEKIDTVI